MIERICARAGIEVADLPDRHLAYRDRHGRLHLTFGAALHLARAFAAAEPGTVLLHIDTDERTYVTKASEPFNSYLVPLVEQWRAGWALVRQWAGTDAQLARKDKEIERLRQVIGRTIWDLRSAGEDRMASKLDRQLRGG